MTDAGVTIVDFQSMAEAINSYRQKISAITNIVQSLQTTQAALAAGNVFTGGAATAVLEAINTYITVMNKAIENLDIIVGVLQGKLESYQQAHQQAMSIASSIEQVQGADV